MKINARNLGIAGAVTFCLGYTIFALLLRFFPNHILKFVGMIHMMPKLEYIKPFITVTPQAVALGALTHTVLIFLFFWFIATIYNLFQR